MTAGQGATERLCSIDLLLAFDEVTMTVEPTESCSVQVQWHLVTT